MHKLLLSALAAVVAFAPHVSAQPRPQLAGGADPNDWESYFEVGRRLFTNSPREADAAFLWAGRLDPTRAEPLMARWAAFYARNDQLYIEYLEGEIGLLRREDVTANEENLQLAFIRNPFVHRGFEAALIASLSRRLDWDRATDVFLDYGRGEFADAARDFGRLIERSPRRNLRLRHYRALSFIGAGQSDSAAVELERLLEALRALDDTQVADEYESKAQWEQALGLIYETRGDSARARRAYERSLEEDLAWYPARMGLARLEENAGNLAGAAEQLAQAVEVAPGDGVLRLEYCQTLLGARRAADAVEHCEAALREHPFWAEAYLRTGGAYDMLGRREDAAKMYRQYLDRAPRRQPTMIDRVTRRLAQLEVRGSAGADSRTHALPFTPPRSARAAR